MAGIRQTARPRRHQRWFGSCVLFCSCVVAIGCGQSGSQMHVDGAPTVRVMYQGKPLGDIQVRLHANHGGPVLAQAISQQNGNAYFPDVPSPEPDKYFVTLESLGDGGWMLDAAACESLTETSQLNALQSSPSQRIEIPNGAVAPLPIPRRHVKR